MGRRWMVLLALAITTLLMIVLVSGWLDVGPLAGHVGGEGVLPVGPAVA